MSVDSTEKWINGLKLKERRLFSLEESTEVRRYINRTRKIVWSLILGYPIGLFFIGLLMNSKLNQINFFKYVFMFIMISYSLIGFTLLANKSVELFKIIKHLKRDLKNAVIDKFEVVMTNDGLPKNNNIGRKDVKNNIEVLPETGLVFRLDGDRPAKPIIVEIAEVAKAADDVLTAPLSEDFLGTETNRYYEHSQRHITPEETEEIKGKIKVMRRTVPLGWFYYGFVAFLILCAILAIFREGLSAFYKNYRPPFFALLVMTFFAARTLFYKWRFIWWLEKNLEMGIMVIATRKKSPEPDPGSKYEIVEFLPVAGLDWTLDGKPSEWRAFKE